MNVTRPERTLIADGRARRSARRRSSLRAAVRSACVGAAIGLIAALVLFVVVPICNLVVPAGSAFHVSDYWVTLIGKIMCYAIVALAMDLIWGYTGILSLGHGLFFALGGYAMGMYLMRSIGRDGVLPERPARLHGVPRLEGATLVLELHRPLLVRGAARRAGARPARVRVRLLRLPLADQGRLFLDHHAGADLRRSCCCSSATTPASAATTASPTSSASSAFRSRRRKTRMALFVLTGAALLGFLLLGRAHRRVEARPRADGDPRRRDARHVLRLQPAVLQALHLDAVGGDLRHRRGAVRAAGRHHQPERDVAGQLDRDRDLDGGGRPRHADRTGRSARPSSISARAGSRRRCPNTGCSRSACCSSW